VKDFKIAIFFPVVAENKTDKTTKIRQALHLNKWSATPSCLLELSFVLSVVWNWE